MALSSFLVTLTTIEVAPEPTESPISNSDENLEYSNIPSCSLMLMVFLFSAFSVKVYIVYSMVVMIDENALKVFCILILI